MWYRAELVDQYGEGVVVQQQWVSPAQDHFADRGVFREPADGTRGTIELGGVLSVGKVAAEAVAAVNGAGAGEQQQGAALIFPQETRGAHRCPFTDRIGAETRRAPKLFRERQDLAQQGILGIRRRHERDLAAWDQKAESLRHRACRGEQSPVQVQDTDEFFRTGDRHAQLLLPRMTSAQGFLFDYQVASGRELYPPPLHRTGRKKRKNYASREPTRMSPWAQIIQAVRPKGLQPVTGIIRDREGQVVTLS